jgi:hypothetical protein
MSLNACCMSALSEGNMIIMVILDSSFWWRPGTPLEAEEHPHELIVLSHQRQIQMRTDRVVTTTRPSWLRPYFIIQPDCPRQSYHKCNI